MTKTTTSPAPEAAAAPDAAAASETAPAPTAAPAPDGAALLAAACEALRTARRAVQKEASAASATSQDARENATRRDWSKACADELAHEIERSDPDDAVVAALRAVMFSPFAS
jgi:hypothetical protein